MLRRDNEQGIGLADLSLEPGGACGERVLLVLVEHREIVNLDGPGCELSLAQPGQRPRQLAVDGLPAIAANHHGDIDLWHLWPHLSYHWIPGLDRCLGSERKNAQRCYRVTCMCPRTAAP